MNVAFIPVRGGSKSIPLKNIKEMCGKPLIYWTTKAACECKYIDKVYIATDSEAIKDTVLSFGKEQTGFDKIEVIGRSKESAVDTASTEFAMLEFATRYDFDNIVLIQATSPLLTGEDLNKGFKLFEEPDCDSVLSAVRQKRFHWDIDEKGIAKPTNYDVYNRPRRQDFKGYLVENGAFYITSKDRLFESKNRVSGNMKIVEMDEASFFEIDEVSDWIIVENLMRNRGFEQKTMPEIKMFLTDCDGCLTDGGMYYTENGDEIKKFNAKDGMGLSLLRAKGIITGVITGEKVELNRRRAEKLKLDVYEEGCKDKAAALRKYCEKYDIAPENVLFIGDDVNDLEAMKLAGYACCPNNAMPKIKAVADYISPLKGGEGVVREIADKVIAGMEKL